MAVPLDHAPTGTVNAPARANGIHVLASDRQAIARFFDLLFRYATPGTYVSLRAFDQWERGKPPILIDAVRIPEWGDDIVDHACAAAERAAAEHGVFAPPISTFRTHLRAAESDIADGVAISVDLDHAGADGSLQILESLIGPATVVVHSGSLAEADAGELKPKLHAHWRLCEPAHTPEEIATLNQTRRLAALISSGDITASSPCHPLRWPGSLNVKATKFGRAPRMATIARENADAEVDLQEAYERLQEAVEARGLDLAPAGAREPGAPQGALSDLRKAMEIVPNDARDWADWNRLGMALWSATSGSEDGLSIFLDWSAKASKFDHATTVARWRHYAKSPPTKIGAGTLYFEAREADPSFRPVGDIKLFDGKVAPEIQGAQAPTSDLELVSFDPARLARLKPRRWIYGRHYIAGYAVAMVAPGGMGKTTIALTEAIAIATGLPLLGEPVHEAMPVAHMNLEDPLDELDRRVWAICLHFGIDPARLRGRLFLYSARERDLCVMTRNERGVAVVHPDAQMLEEQIVCHGIGVVQIDPFVSSHDLDENDNKEINAVVRVFNRIAERTQCCFLLSHHVRKPPSGAAHANGDINAARGASALSGAVRSARTFGGMSKEDAERFGPTALDGDPMERRGWYMRSDDAKANLSPPAERATWFRRVSITLPGMPDDDTVGVLERWAPPDPFTGFSMEQVTSVLREIDDGWRSGDFFGVRTDAKRSVIRLIGAVFASKDGQPDLAKAKQIVAAWTKSGVLVVEMAKTKNYEERQAVRVGMWPGATHG